ncbi:hypothetical protein RDWZM_010193 [Blomia tropicalis]|uniref:Superoxide dismutase copper/zinc binding domain-containing protein n=2 Tax=Blomia tropicalis TaxID=40697 RepID=A0A9Q0RHG7_BLOTA|nr:hypothetical protein RDWZM_010193 [Blomia tropicalis]
MVNGQIDNNNNNNGITTSTKKWIPPWNISNKNNNNNINDSHQMMEDDDETQRKIAEAHFDLLLRVNIASLRSTFVQLYHATRKCINERRKLLDEVQVLRINMIQSQKLMGNNGTINTFVPSSSSNRTLATIVQFPQHIHYHYHYHHNDTENVPKTLATSETLPSSTQVSSSSITTKTTMESDHSTMSNYTLAQCDIVSNRHIPLLNQQNIGGTIRLWQMKNETDSIYVQIRLNGFKIYRDDEGRIIREPSQTNRTIPIGIDRSDYIDSSQLNDVPLNSTERLFAIAIHETSNMTRDCQSIGRHYNRANFSDINEYAEHMGDMGNIIVHWNGESMINVRWNGLNLSDHENGIMDRSIAIRNYQYYGMKMNISSEERYISKTASRIGCCAIRSINSDRYESLEQFLN